MNSFATDTQFFDTRRFKCDKCGNAMYISKKKGEFAIVRCGSCKQTYLVRLLGKTAVKIKTLSDFLEK